MPKKLEILIQPVGFEAPVSHAAAELARYLPLLADVSAQALPELGGAPADSAAQIVLGTAAHMRGLGLGQLPKESDVDDALAIVPKDKRLYLIGSNARSVLFAAYRLLEELGAIFLRPGPGGEVLPKRKHLALPKKPIREAASYRHRGICIEGYPRLDHVLDTLDWMAKRKMNAFQLQFRYAGVFWRRGYEESPEMGESGKAKLTQADYAALDDRVIAHAKALGMMIHRVGHGWTAAALGYPGIDWNEPPTHPVAREKRDWPALVGGKRGLFRGEPSNTELCYSNPDVREAFIQEVLEYAKQHSEVDYLHVWLSDASNNNCECATCRKKTPTDWYIALVNEVGDRMKAEKMPMRIVFLAYSELLWPPVEERIRVDNATLMYAPSWRCYRHAFTDEACGDELPKALPELNRYPTARNNRQAAELAAMWKALKLPDTFLFDYYGWRAMWVDGIGTDLGNWVARDMKDLDALGLDGHISCQCIRCFYPLPYFMNVMADTLWDKRLSTAAHRKRIMAAAFGAHAAEVERYFSQLIGATRNTRDPHESVLTPSPAHAKEVMRVEALPDAALQRFGMLAKREKDPVVRTSLGLVAIHAEQISRIARACQAGIRGDAKALARLRSNFEARLPQILGEFSHWVDVKFAEPARETFAEAERSIKRR